MAIYTYQCNRCGAQGEVYQSIKSYCEKPNRPICCGAEMERYLTPVMGIADMEPFVSPIDGTLIRGRADRREHMIKHNVVPTDEIMPDIERNRKEIRKKMFEGVREDILKAEHMVKEGYKPQLDTMKTDTEVSVPGAM